MGEGKRKIYKKRRPLLTALKVLSITVAALIVIGIALFFGLQKYIVYTPDGVKLDLPFLQEYRNNAARPAETELNT